MPACLKLIISYKYEEEPILKLLCARMLEDAFRRRPDVEVYHTGEIDSAAVDVVFNTLPLGNAEVGKITAWWDIEACNFMKTDWFQSDVVLAPYHLPEEGRYPPQTYLMPFATDPQFWRYHPCEYGFEVGFVGRGDGNRSKRMEWLHYIHDALGDAMLWGNGIERGAPVSWALSRAKVLLQVSGDAAGGVMETRFFEIGLIGPLVVDVTDVNRRDYEWAATPGYHFEWAETKEQMLEKALWLAQHDAEREAMFARARDNYMARHTYDVRAREFLETVGFLKGAGFPRFFP